MTQRQMTQTEFVMGRLIAPISMKTDRTAKRAPMARP